MAIQPELTTGESIVWAGRPQPGPIFHREDLFLVPFSLLWGGFALFWEAGVSGFGRAHKAAAGPLFFFQLWGIPFVLIGQYFIWGRFIYAAWLKKRTYYAVTNRRVLVVQNGGQRKVASCYLDTLPTLIKESGSNGRGVLRFTQPLSVWGGRGNWGAWNPMNVGEVPVFVDVEDVDSVYRVVSDMREKARTARLAS
jgi:hypothetical protein